MVNRLQGNEEDKKLEYCKRLIELLCRENPEFFPEIVKAGLRGVETAQTQRNEGVELTS